jgi:acetylornithine deacetylase/succinyl-diaminopimelate desuccinylase-like protein
VSPDCFNPPNQLNSYDVPTVLLYAHYDVQPPGEGWTVITDPFDPKVVNGRLYGRGAADDQSGIIMHLGAVQAFDGKPPVNLKIMIEGEEESGKAASKVTSHIMRTCLALILLSSLTLAIGNLTSRP